MEYGVVPFETVMSMGEVFAKSGYFTDAKQQAQAVVKMLAGQEMGVGPFASMSGIHIIQGKPEVGAHLLAAVLKRSGKYDYRIKQPVQVDSVTLEFFERDGDKWTSLGLSTFTAEDAKKAGTGNMQKFPRNMLFARALSNGVKWYCPDVSLSPLYSRGEIDQAANVEYVDAEFVEQQQEPQPRLEPAVQSKATKKPPAEIQNGNRPWNAETVRHKITGKVQMLQDDDSGEWLEDVQPGHVGALVGKLNGILGGDDRRHTCLEFIFSQGSSKELEKSEVEAMLRYIDKGDPSIVTDELNRLVNSVVTKDAVGTLPGIDSVKGDAKAPF